MSSAAGASPASRSRRASGSAEVRRVLEPVYAAMDLEWSPETTGAVEDEVAEADLAGVEAAIVSALSERFELVEADLDPEILAAAEALAKEHLSPRE